MILGILCEPFARVGLETKFCCVSKLNFRWQVWFVQSFQKQNWNITLKYIVFKTDHSAARTEEMERMPQLKAQWPGIVKKGQWCGKATFFLNRGFNSYQATHFYLISGLHSFTTTNTFNKIGSMHLQTKNDILNVFNKTTSCASMVRKELLVYLPVDLL